MVPKNTANRVSKSKGLGKGVQIKISKANVRKQTGSGILTSVLTCIKKCCSNYRKNSRSLCTSWIS